MASSLNRYLEDLYDRRVKVSNDDRSESREAVEKKLKKILSKFKDGGAYKKTYIKAGSHPDGTKIKRADEFDFNVPLNVQPRWKDDGEVPYTLKRRRPRGNETNKTHHDKKRKRIPQGFYAVKAVQSKNCKDIMHLGYIVPKFVKDDFYNKMKKIVLKMPDITLSPYEHGPAIMFRLKRPGKYTISVDISPSIEMDNPIPLAEYGWPRQATRECLDQELIEKVRKAATHFIPKDDEFWSLSFSSVEKSLMSNIDQSGECRKKCHKLLKSDFEHWKRKQKKNFPGISTHVFKHLLFWYNEKCRGAQWRKKNLGKRYIGMLKMLKKKLRQGVLKDYFDPDRNIIKNKDSDVLEQLADRVEERITQLREKMAT